MAFDTIDPIKLGQVAVGTSNTLVGTVPLLTRWILKDMDLANDTTAPVRVRVFAGDGVLSPGNVLLPNVSIPANATLQWTGTQNLNAGDSIYAIASAVGVTLTASGGSAI